MAWAQFWTDWSLALTPPLKRISRSLMCLVLVGLICVQFETFSARYVNYVTTKQGSGTNGCSFYCVIVMVDSLLCVCLSVSWVNIVQRDSHTLCGRPCQCRCQVDIRPSMFPCFHPNFCSDEILSDKFPQVKLKPNLVQTKGSYRLRRKIEWLIDRWFILYGSHWLGSFTYTVHREIQVQEEQAYSLCKLLNKRFGLNVSEFNSHHTDFISICFWPVLQPSCRVSWHSTSSRWA